MSISFGGIYSCYNGIMLIFIAHFTFQDCEGSNSLAIITVESNDGKVGLVGVQCPGMVNLLCEGIELTSLRWKFNEENNTIATYIPADNANRVTPLFDNPAFIAVQLTSVDVINKDFANFSSILTANISQLKEQNITSIICGDPLVSAVEPVNVTVIRTSLPENPVFTEVSASYKSNKLEEIHVSWMKLPLKCSMFEAMLHYSVTLMSTTVNRMSTVTHDNCLGTNCSTVFAILESDSKYRISLYAINAVGTSGVALFPNEINQRSSYYYELHFNASHCGILYAQCTSSLNILGNDSYECVLFYYGDDSEYQQLISNAVIRLNGGMEVIHLARTSTHYFKITMGLNTSLQIVESFTYQSNSCLLANDLPVEAIAGIATVTFIFVLSLLVITFGAIGCCYLCNKKERRRRNGETPLDESFVQNPYYIKTVRRKGEHQTLHSQHRDATTLDNNRQKTSGTCTSIELSESHIYEIMT